MAHLFKFDDNADKLHIKKMFQFLIFEFYFSFLIYKWATFYKLKLILMKTVLSHYIPLGSKPRHPIVMLKSSADLNETQISPCAPSIRVQRTAVARAL